MTSAVSHHLSEILLAKEDKASSAGRELSHGAGWDDAVALARSWKVTPQLFSRIRNLGLVLPPAASVALRREFVRVYGQSTVHADQAVKAIRALQQKGIPVAVFKGAASLAWLYSDPKLRTLGDADLLVQPQDLEKALECLEACGLRREGSGSFAEFVHFRIVGRSC